ncbi:hypothetical protein, partial [Bacillus safensis]|uniref:hypothetical protein n=1 Tax=Bacillus safensis TaxID=561879 RepID=UPI002DBECA5B
RVGKPSHSVSGLRAGAHECHIRSAPVLVLPRAAKVFYHAERRQMAKIKIILFICQQFETPLSKDKGVIFIQQLVWLVR